MSEAEFARADAVAGLAREVAGLRRRLDETSRAAEALPAEVDVVAARIDDLARTVAQLADVVAATPARPTPSPAPSWLEAPDDPEGTGRVLGELCRWLERVFLRYPDGVGALPECWLWHPEVVEELLWLQHAWAHAYRSDAASAALAGDWHDRQRPGVVRRFKATVASCSRERHQHRPGWSHAPATSPTVPCVEAVPAIADWWARGRASAPPEPPAREPGGGFDAALHTNPPGHLASVPRPAGHDRNGRPGPDGGPEGARW